MRGDLFLPPQLETIEEGAFDLCLLLTGLHFSRSNKIRHLGEGCFCNCANMRGTLQIPAGMESVGDHCFLNTGFDTCIVYSEKCHLGDMFVKPTVTIVGFKDSTAEAYARKFGNPFRILE